MNLMPTALKKMFPDKVSRRRFTRHNCHIAAELHFIEDGLTIQGCVSEISQGGLKFKPNQTFIMRRYGGIVRVNIASGLIEASVKNTSPYGYGVAFAEELTPQEIHYILTSQPVKLNS